ncbi:Tautomerase/MIF superfamily [Apodospora peruviana]|uniref:L-dopachrome isomerase n=1 Tax=Apodospora peruviana TaxID=516989 RepID=A0AAE0HW03_9PEZI|nr:Tautomerase/MIF superfamily [Apodospora peruviana]
MSTSLSFAERRAKRVVDGAVPPIKSHLLVDGSNLLRDIDRPPPGDVVRGPPPCKSQSKPDLVKKRSNLDFFENAFSTTENNPAKERVHGDAIVLAEVKTNVIINDEFSFITELSYHLSTRYQRPVSSIVVTLHHGACMLFGGSFDPAYVMSISALPSQLQPTTNRRNTAVIQKHMEEVLGVTHSRGLLKFVPVNEENLACNGNTMTGEIEDLQKSYGGARISTAVLDDSTHLGSKRLSARKKLSVKSLATNFQPPQASGGTNVPALELTPPSSATDQLPPVPESPSPPPATAEKSQQQQHQIQGTAASQQKSARRKKSFVATMFGRSSTTKSEFGSSMPAPVAE